LKGLCTSKGRSTCSSPHNWQWPITSNKETTWYGASKILWTHDWSLVRGEKSQGYIIGKLTISRRWLCIRNSNQVILNPFFRTNDLHL
jgi:hypothetical protein